MTGELALAIVLLTAAGLLLESFWNLQHIDPGFQADHLLTMQLTLPRTKYPAAADLRAFYAELIPRLQAAPGMRGAGAVSFRPFLSMGSGTSLEVENGSYARSGEAPSADYRVITPDFMRVLAQPLLAGRDFSAHDGPKSEDVAIINESMARESWPNRSAVGERFRPNFSHTDIPWMIDSPPRWLKIVGVVRDVKGFIPDDREQSLFYVCSLQFPSAYMFLIIRTDGPPLGALATTQDQIRNSDPDQPVYDVRSMEDAISVYAPRFNVELLGLFAAIAVLLAAIGVYGVASYAVSQRTQEIGVRMALGARPDDVLRMIVGEAIHTGLLSIVLGVTVSLALSHSLAGLLYGVAGTDVRVYASAVAILFAVVLMACYFPARRAARLDPSVALRM